MSFRETAPVANTRTSRSLPTTLAAEAHRAEGQCLLQGQAPNNENSLIIIIIIIIIIIKVTIACALNYHIIRHYYARAVYNDHVGYSCSMGRT
jgi:hypothetical protein